MKFQIVPFENTPENARNILGNLGQNIDVVGGIFDETMLRLRGCAGLELFYTPLCCAVSVYHPLAEKKHPADGGSVRAEFDAHAPELEHVCGSSPG